MREFIEWWAGLSPWIRFGVAITILVLSTALWFGGPLLGWNLHATKYAWVGWPAGVVLLVFSFPSRTERKGYHDF